jgi:hypothetical protein
MPTRGDQVTAATTSTSPGVTIALGVIWLLVIIAEWRVLAKAGKPGWGAIIPIYNLYLICKVAKRPGWWWVLFIIPVVNVVITIIVMLDVAKAFKKGVGFGIGLILLNPLFMMILGYGSAEYDGSPAA